MKKIIFIVIIIVVAAAGLGYLFFVYLPSRKKQEGAPCKTDNGSDGTIQGGICVKAPIGGMQHPSPTPGSVPALSFITNQNLYLNINEPESIMGQNDRKGTPIYTYPSSTSATYLLGVVEQVWYAGAPVGKFVSEAGNFVKIKISNLRIWKNQPPTYPYANDVSGDYFILKSAIQKTPY